MGILGLLVLVKPAHSQGDSLKSSMPSLNTAAPNFALIDVTGKKFALNELAKGKSAVVLFFFCGCTWCTDVAREWATLQRANALPDKMFTIIVYQGTISEAKSLAHSCGLDVNNTVLLPDPKYTVTAQVYKADPCPRVFVLAPDIKNRLIVRYVNTNKDDEPRKAPASLIVAKTVSALKR